MKKADTIVQLRRSTPSDSWYFHADTFQFKLSILIYIYISLFKLQKKKLLLTFILLDLFIKIIIFFLFSIKKKTKKLVEYTCCKLYREQCSAVVNSMENEGEGGGERVLSFYVIDTRE